MKHTPIYIFLFLSSIFSAFAQKTDTTNLGAKAMLFVADSVNHKAYNFAKSSPFYLKSLMPVRFNKLSAGYNFEKGNLKSAQSAATLNDTYLSTEGISQLNSISIWGEFTYHRIVEDSIAFAHETKNNITNPYYFGSPKSVSYQRAIYNLKALASKNFIKNNLPIGLGVDYRIGNHYSTNDPRGDLSDHQLNLTGTIGYHITKLLSIGAGYRYGYGSEKVNIAYKNSSLSQGYVIPEYNNYLINGYGEPEIFNTDRTFQNNAVRNGLDVYLSYNSNDIGNFNLSFQSIKETQDYDYRNGEGIVKYIKFNIVNEHYKLFWLKNIAKNSLIIEFGYQTNDGDNYLNKFLTNSYLYNNNTLNLKSVFTLKKNLFTHNFGVDLKKYEERKRDGIAGNDVSFKQLNYTINYGLSHTGKNMHNWGFSLTGLYNQYLDSDFEVLKINEGVFTRNVIYHDYAYQTTSKFGGSLTFDYSIPLFNQIQAGIKLNTTYLRRNDLKDFDRTLTNAPGKDRFFTNISLNLYF